MELISVLQRYVSVDEKEEKNRQKMLALLNEVGSRAFLRTCYPAHFTASAWVLNQDKTKVVLMQHKKLQQWLQPGGHCDGNADVIAVARKELFEETGITDLCLLSNEPFDLDIHAIPERFDIPAHEHYDIRFLFQANSQKLQRNDESTNIAWVPLVEIEKYTDNASVLKMKEKIIKRLA